MDPFASIPAPFPSAPSRQEMGDDDLHHGADSTNPQKNESNHNPTGSDDDDVNTRSAGTPAAADFMSDVSDEEEALSTAQRFAMAFSCKDEGTRLVRQLLAFLVKTKKGVMFQMVCVCITVERE